MVLHSLCLCKPLQFTVSLLEEPNVTSYNCHINQTSHGHQLSGNTNDGKHESADNVWISRICHILAGQRSVSHLTFSIVFADRKSFTVGPTPYDRTVCFRLYYLTERLKTTLRRPRYWRAVWDWYMYYGTHVTLVLCMISLLCIISLPCINTFCTIPKVCLFRWSKLYSCLLLVASK